MRHHVTAVAGAALLTAAAASVVLVGGSGPSAAADVPSSAFGISATGLAPIPPTPKVVSTDGSLVADSAASVPDNPVVSGGLLEVAAQNPEAGARLTDLAVGNGILSMLPEDLAGQLQPVCDALGQVPLDQVTDPVTGQVLEGALQDALDQVSGSAPIDLSAITALDLSQLLPDQLTGMCDLLSGDTGLVDAKTVHAYCAGGVGFTSLVDLKALGLPVDVDAGKPNTSVEIPGVVKLTVNRQTHNADGSFTVDALVLDLFGQEEVVIASATCGRLTVPTHEPTHPTDDPPSPTPVQTELPVTG